MAVFRPSSIQARMLATVVVTFFVTMTVVLVAVYFYTRQNNSVIEMLIESSEDIPEGAVVTGTAEIATATGNNTPWVDRMWWWLGVLTITAIGASGAAWFLSRRAFGRLERLADVARSIDEQHLHHRFETTSNDDEIDQLSSAINGALDRLQSGIERQRQFVRTASHEMRTPLTLARSALEIPRVEGVFEGEARDTVDIALVAQIRLEKILNALLILSQVDEFFEQREVVDLRDLIDEGLADLPPSDIDWTVRGDGVEIESTIGLLDLAVRNLLRNAVDHNSANGWASIAIERAHDGVLLVIENGGAIIDEDAVASLVLPFSKRVDSPGSGLGLSIADRAVHALAGTMALTARSEGGLKVELWLPFSPDYADVDQAHRANHRPAG